MISLALSDLEVEVQPELAEVALRRKLSKEYFCWLILKKLDETMSSGGGKMSRKKVKEKLMHMAGRSRSTVDRYLDSGDKIFWRFDKYKNVIYLNSFEKVCLALDIVHIYSYNVIYHLGLIEENFDRSCKSLLMAAIASKTGNPVSNMNLADRGGVCRRTVQNYLNESVGKLDVAHKIENYCLLSRYNDYLSAHESIGHFVKAKGFNIGSITIRRYKNEYLLLKQIPNSIINRTGRSSIRQEKQKLKGIAGRPHVTKHEKRYILNGAEKAGLEYLRTFADDGNTLHDIGEFNMRVFVERGV